MCSYCEHKECLKPNQGCSTDLPDHTLVLLQYTDPFNAIQPGRPIGSKKKKPDKSYELSSESSIDASEN